MAFPTTPVLTNFTGANENPLSEGGAWAGPVRTGGQLRCQRFSNQAEAINGSTGESIWNTTFAADQEVYAVISALPAAGIGFNIFARCQSEGTASADYYNLSYTEGTGWRYFKMIDEGFTQLGGVISTLVAAVGDSCGFSVIGTTLQGYHKPAAGSWATLGVSQTDSSVTGAGKIGFSLSDSDTAAFDNFGGGAVVSSVPRVPIPRVISSGARW